MYSIASFLRHVLSGYLKESPVVTVCDDQPDKSLCCECPEKPLHLFENLPPSYDPSTWWLDGQPSPYPHFQEAERIQYHIKTIKESLLRHILQGCRTILEAKGHHLLSSVKDHELLWKAAISAQKYGVVYLASRRDCREEFLSAAESQPSLFAEISAFLSSNSNANRVINYGVHQLVNSQEFKVDHETRLIPPTAISAIGVNHIAVREKDFTGDGTSMLETPSAIWDLHDFAHLSAASISPRLYGSKYFTHLNKLPPKLTALIRSPKMKTSEPSPRISDGVVFSEILTVLFTSEVQERANSHTYSSLTNVLADYVADYLMGTRELKHLTTGVMLKVKSPIQATELATLAQNKAYELTASEIEQRVFTRGGPVGCLLYTSPSPRD